MDSDKLSIKEINIFVASLNTMGDVLRKRINEGEGKPILPPKYIYKKYFINFIEDYRNKRDIFKDKEVRDIISFILQISQKITGTDDLLENLRCLSRDFYLQLGGTQAEWNIIDIEPFLEDYLEEYFKLIIESEYLDKAKDCVITLLRTINLEATDFEIKEFEINEHVVLTYYYVEKLLQKTFKNFDYKTVLEYPVQGFFKMWRSEKYFNQEEIRKVLKRNRCISLNVDELVGIPLLSTTSFVRMKAIIEANCGELNEQQNQILQEFMIYKFQNIKLNNKSITIKL